MKDLSHRRAWMTRSIVVTLCAVGSLLWAKAASAEYRCCESRQVSV